MMSEKERFEILLEEVRGDIRILAEGLTGLRQEMERRFETLYQALHQEISDVRREVIDGRNVFKLYAKQTDQRLIALENRGK